MSPEPEVPESPATWENVVVGEAKNVAGRVLRNKELIEDGEEHQDAGACERTPAGPVS